MNQKIWNNPKIPDMEIKLMFLKDGTNLYFNPGCALNLYGPESAEKIFKYLQNSFPKIQMHNICCGDSLYPSSGRPALPTVYYRE